jgi:hypothetical protein
MTKAKDATRILMDFAWDYAIKGRTDHAKRQSYMNLACSAWNMSFLSKNELSQAIVSFIDNITIERDYDEYEDDRKDVEGDIWEMIRLKRKKFNKCRYYFLSVELHEEDDIVTCEAKFRDYDELMDEIRRIKEVEKNG